jgi:hypothetical protein
LLEAGELKLGFNQPLREDFSSLLTPFPDFQRPFNFGLSTFDQNNFALLTFGF